jgi:hypothetical protein
MLNIPNLLNRCGKLEEELAICTRRIATLKDINSYLRADRNHLRYVKNMLLTIIIALVVVVGLVVCVKF